MRLASGGQHEERALLLDPGSVLPDSRSRHERGSDEPGPRRDWAMLFAYFSLPILMLVSQIVLQKMSQPASTATVDR